MDNQPKPKWWQRILSPITAVIARLIGVDEINKQPVKVNKPK
jgi:hypothetical protein